MLEGAIREATRLIFILDSIQRFLKTGSIVAGSTETLEHLKAWRCVIWLKSVTCGILAASKARVQPLRRRSALQLGCFDALD